MDFIEGRISLHVKATGDAYAFVQLDQSVVDCTPNEVGMDSWFYALTQYTPVTFLDELATRLQSIYAMEVQVVDGRPGGLLLKRVEVEN